MGFATGPLHIVPATHGVFTSVDRVLRAWLSQARYRVTAARVTHADTGGGNLPNDLRSSRHAVNHSASKS